VAIKGKRKAQNRGSQARRRPALAPRPAPGRVRKAPWYKTTAGQTIAAISTMIVLVVGLVLWNNAREAADRLEASQSRLETLSDQAEALLQRITGPVTEMSTAGTQPAEDLESKATEWKEALAAAQTEVTEFVVAEEDPVSTSLFTQAINLFRSAAETLEVATTLEGKQRTDLVSAASTQVQSAAGVWDAAVSALDEARDEYELTASGVGSPIAGAASATVPGAGSTTPIDPGAGDGSDQGQGGGQGKGTGGKKGDNADG
jgi:hypothetical protein